MREVKVGKRYKHFKGHIYQVNNIAYDCNSNDSDLIKMVVYTNVEDNITWVRNYDEFISEVDHEKYPNIKQKYRFEELK